MAGHIFAEISIIFNIPIRFIIFLFQCVVYLIFLSLIFFYFYDLKKNYFFYLSLFCPLLITYHVAELEILVRKEVLIFIHFFVFLILNRTYVSTKYSRYYLIISLPIILLIWEPILFFFPFYILILIHSNNYNDFKKFFRDIFLSFISSVPVIFLILFNDFNTNDEKFLCEELKRLLDQNCYMSLLVLDETISDSFGKLFSDIKLTYILRYSLIYVVGFFPLVYLIKKSAKNISFKIKFFESLNIFILFILASIFVPILFMMALDWGRWVNIHYLFSLSSFYFLIKNKHYHLKDLNIEYLKKKYLFNNKYLIVIFFILFCFGWNPKTLYKGDVGSFPGYRVPYNFISSIVNK